MEQLRTFTVNTNTYIIHTYTNTHTHIYIHESTGTLSHSRAREKENIRKALSFSGSHPMWVLIAQECSRNWVMRPAFSHPQQSVGDCAECCSHYGMPHDRGEKYARGGG